MQNNTVCRFHILTDANRHDYAKENLHNSLLCFFKRKHVKQNGLTIKVRTHNVNCKYFRLLEINIKNLNCSLNVANFLIIIDLYNCQTQHKKN